MAQIQAALEAGQGVTPLDEYTSLIDFGAGSHVAVTALAPQNFKDTDGSFQPIDPTLHVTSGGYANGDGPVDLTFPSSLSTGSGITFQAAGATLTFSPISGTASAHLEDDSNISYVGVAPHTNLSIATNTVGYVEQLILQQAPSSDHFTWTVGTNAGTTLHLTDTGSISVIQGVEEVASIPPPVAFDSAVDPTTGTLTRSDGFAYELAPVVGGYQLTLRYDALWLAAPTRAFPVMVDPSPEDTTLDANRDTYTSEDGCADHATPYWQSNTLEVGFIDAVCNHYAFVDFQTDPLVNPDRVVLGAHFLMGEFSSSNTSNEIGIKRITTSWTQANVTGDNEPPAEGDGTGHNWASESVAADGSYDWPLGALYQQVVDGRKVDYGLRLQAINHHVLFSSDSASTPKLFVSYDDLPPAPELNGPFNGKVIPKTSPTLSISAMPTDPNGDDVLVQFQISSSTDFSNPVMVSPWLDTTTWPVDAGVLKDGQTYNWRAIAADACGPESAPGPCAIPGWADREYNASDTADTPDLRSFTIAIPHYGSDRRWAMWAQSLGNDMGLAVNQANGNLFLNYPLDTLATPSGPLSLSLTYNSQSPDDVGLGAGWNISAGPGSDGTKLPVRLVEDLPAIGDGVRILFGDGDQQAFTKSDSQTVYRSGGGTVTATRDSTGTVTDWTFLTLSGSIYTFNGDGLLTGARPSSGSAVTPGFTYQFNTTPPYHPLTVTDAIGREVEFHWVAGRLQSINTWDSSVVWTPHYASFAPSSAQKLASIDDPAGATVRFGYDGALANVPMTTVEDGTEVATAVTTDKTTISYIAGTPPDPIRVSSVRFPDDPAATEFDYDVTLNGSIVKFTYVTDPRGVLTPTAFDYSIYTAFNTAGLPITITGPPVVDTVSGGGIISDTPTTRMVWDTNGNMLCTRSPAAIRMVHGTQCVAGSAGISSADLSDELNTYYTYSSDAPFPLLSQASAAPSLSAPRAYTNYTYDEGIAGLVARIWPNRGLRGLPAGEWIDPSIDETWPDAPGHGVTTSDVWSIRYSGLLQVPASHTYLFRVSAVGAYRLMVNNKVVVNCWDSPVAGGPWSNCNLGDGSAKEWLGIQATGGQVPITLEFKDLPGAASLKLEWTWGSNPFALVGGLRPNLNAVTSVSDPWGTTNYSYANDEDLLRSLPSRVARGGRRVDRTYDGYGRVKTEANARGETTTYTYLDSGNISCRSSVTDPTGALMEYECDPSGEVTKTKQHVPAVAGTLQSTSQIRIVNTEYDALGRLKRSSLPYLGATPSKWTVNVYDDAGRLKQATDPMGNVTTATYDSEGRVKTKTDADPDGAGPLTSPATSFTYDPTGNLKTRTDPRGFVWTTAYDALNRVISTTDPEGNSTSTLYSLGNSLTISRSAPGIDGAVTESRTYRDLLGRVTTEGLGSLNRTEHTYADFGASVHVDRIVDPTGNLMDTTYNTFGEVVSTLHRVDVAVDEPGCAMSCYVTGTTAYDGAGRVSSVTDEQGNATSYGYDAAGRLVGTTRSVSGHPEIVSFDYDAAGEKIRQTIALASGSITHEWAYDEAGHMVASKDARGTTSYEYFDDSLLKHVVPPVSSPVIADQYFEYDALGRRTRRYGKVGTATVDNETFTYDPAGNPATAATAAVTASMQYDHDGRLTQVVEGTATTTYHYTGTQLDSRTDPSGSAAFTYRPWDGLPNTVSDSLDGTVYQFYYMTDNSGRLVARKGGGLEIALDYYTGGALKSETYTAHTTAAGSDSASPPPVVVASFELGYNKSSDVVKNTQNVLGYTNIDNGTWTYGYDEAHRLVSASDPNQITSTYAYDGAGNRTSVQVGNKIPPTISHYDAAGYPTSDTVTDGSISQTTAKYVTDAVGRLTSSIVGTVGWTYGYDAWGRQNKANRTGGGTTAVQLSYAHDALDRTTKKDTTIAGLVASTTYAYSGNTPHLTTLTEPGKLPTDYSWGLEAPLSEHRFGVARRLITDTHGDVVSVMATTGQQILGTTSYGPWGERRIPTGDTGPIGYQGDVTDADTGLVDMVSRLYQPGMGRFTTPDSLPGTGGNLSSLNGFTYAWDSPVTRTDPNGTCPPDAGCGAPFWFSASAAAKWNHNQTTRSRRESHAFHRGDGLALSYALYYAWKADFLHRMIADEIDALRAENEGFSWVHEAFAHPVESWTEGYENGPAWIKPVVWVGMAAIAVSACVIACEAVIGAAQAGFGAVAGAASTGYAWVGALATGVLVRTAEEELPEAGRVIEGATRLFRGVAESHHAFEDALEGTARPGDVFGEADAALHNTGFTISSRLTSWTTDPEIAERFAGKGGVILQTTVEELQARGIGVFPSPDKYSEAEWLVEGIVHGLRVLLR